MYTNILQLLNFFAKEELDFPREVVPQALIRLWARWRAQRVLQAYREGAVIGDAHYREIVWSAEVTAM